MRSSADVVAEKLATIPSVRSETAIFLAMVEGRARVRIGGSEILLPFVGVYPPLVGQVVQVEWRDGTGVVIGPTEPRSSLGVVTAVAAPSVTIDVSGELFTMRYLRSYTPAVGDNVVVMWGEDGGVCLGTTDAPPPPPRPAPLPDAPSDPVDRFDVTVRAENSGRYQSSWWGNDPWASSSNRGIWVYGTRLRDALRGADGFNHLDIFLPLRQEVGACQIGIAQHSAIPGGAPIITDLVDLPLGRRGGWQPLPIGWAGTLALGDRGIGVIAPGGAGYTIWSGTAADPASGQLRIRGIR